jgi:hypothetical protein
MKNTYRRQENTKRHKQKCHQNSMKQEPVDAPQEGFGHRKVYKKNG